MRLRLLAAGKSAAGVALQSNLNVPILHGIRTMEDLKAVSSMNDYY